MFVLTNGAIRVESQRFPDPDLHSEHFITQHLSPTVRPPGLRPRLLAFSSLGLKNDAFIGFALDYFVLVY